MFHHICIPKTASKSITRATAQSPLGVVQHGHPDTFASVPQGDTVIVSVRDPVARFVSGYDYVSRVYGLPPSGGEAFALDIAAQRGAIDAVGHPWIFEPMARWFDAARDCRVVRVESIEEDFAPLTRELGCPMVEHVNRRPPGAHTTTLSDEAIEALREYYAADYRLLAEYLP